MALSLTVRWIGHAYEASASHNPARPEWPPEVVRPFCGMVANAETDAEWAALRWLERQPPPTLICPKAKPSPGRSSYVVTQQIDHKKGGTHPTLPLRMNGRDLRRWPRTFTDSPEVHFVWAEAQPTPDVADTLAVLARRVPYVGRATSAAWIEIEPDADVPPPSEDLEVFEPVARRAGLDRRLLRCLYPGYVDLLRELYEASQPPWNADRRTAYVKVTVQDGGEAVVDGPYGELVPLRFARGASRDGAHIIALAVALRGALRSRGADLPAVHGHHDGSVQQVSFMGMPVVGHKHADGRLLGMALALPADLDDGDQRAIIRAAVGDPLATDEAAQPLTLHAGPVGRLGLEVVDETERRLAFRADRWYGPHQRWASATPIVLDRFPHRRDDIAEMVADSCVAAGYPRPLQVELRRYSPVTGGLDLRPDQAVRRRGDVRRLPTRHAIVRFPDQVRGPVIIGNMRHYGLGLCLPTWEVSDAEG